jgi:hypothetical protein
MIFVSVKITIFWDAMPFSPADPYQYFDETASSWKANSNSSNLKAEVLISS